MLRRSFYMIKFVVTRILRAPDFELWSCAVFCGAFHQLPEYLTYYEGVGTNIYGYAGLQEGFAAMFTKLAATIGLFSQKTIAKPFWPAYNLRSPL